MSEFLSSKENAEFWDGRWKEGERRWDHGRASPAFEEFIDRYGPVEGEMLIPGAGSGHDVRYFASLGVKVTGLDVSPTAVKVAEKENPHPRARYMSGNFLDPPPGLRGRFDWVVEHTCLCSMNPSLWTGYAAAANLVLKPGGQFLAIFYLNPSSGEGPPFRISEQVIDDLFSDCFELLDEWIPIKSYSSRAGREVLRLYRKKD